MKLTQSVHYKSLSSDLSLEKTRQVLAALDHAELLGALKRHPIAAIRIERTGDKRHPGEYGWDAQSITINSGRKPGIHYGADLRPGETHNMSSATKNKVESLRRSLLQETAHHIENSVPNIREIALHGFANPARAAITAYADVNADEYFAECFVAYFVEPGVLAAYDPSGGTMICGIEELLVKQPDIDWTHIQAIVDEAAALEERHAMTRDTWLRLNHDFVNASHGILPMPAVLGRTGQSKWFDLLHGKTSERVA